MAVVNQKEYLKKYLGIGKSHGIKKKKKKSEKTLGKRLKIIDDDLDVSLSEEIKGDLAGDQEDAPQIVSIIDDRPPSLRIDERTKSKNWKPIGAADSDEEEQNATFSQSKPHNLDMDIASRGRKDSDQSLITKRHFSRQDISPPRLKHEIVPKRELSPTDISPQRRTDQDHSPERRRNNDSGDQSPGRRRSCDSADRSPPRRRNNSEDHSPKRQKRDNDQSPPRRRRNDGGDQSPQRQKRDSDQSPPRRKRNHGSGDQSPRKQKNSNPNDQSARKKINRDEDYPPKHEKRRVSGDHSSNLRKNGDARESRNEYIRKDSSRQKTSRWSENSPDSSNITLGKAEKTLSGKKSGLQNAKDLAQELSALKERENELFSKLTAVESGENAVTVLRNKKTISPEEEAELQRKKKELEDKYSKWGKGLKQVEDSNEKWAEQLNVMSKPLARYADDEDLEKYLKDQERDGDPMLMYMRKKKKKKAVEAGISEKPVYLGEFLPNRFGIRPGYRWDGVDRSNGYEVKLLSSRNAEKAQRDEAFMWNTEDM
nr:BUD13 homolog [Leptinotarsa decemlineata]